VDIRPDSATYGQSFGTELSDENGLMLWIPAGFAHGFCVLGDDMADVLYKTDAEYNGDAEGGILWSDPDLAIDWPVTDPIVSSRDENLQTFAQYRADPAPWDR
jgi:dTDP-4-dehydrorhamnose 3,5-epimerase